VTRTLKILAIALGVIVLGIVVLAVALVLLVDPNDYKEEIVQAVKEQTGRELKIEGDLKLSLFPWLGLETGALELANAPGFGKQPFARVAAAGVKVKLLPLLRKELQVNTILIDGLRLQLTRNKAGKTNWDDLGSAETKPPAGTKQAAPDAPTSPAIGALTVGGIDVRNGEIRWRDEQSNTHYTLRNLELKSGQLALDRPLDLTLAFDLESETPPIRTPVKLQTRAKLDLEQQKLDVSKLELAVSELALSASLQATNIETAPLVKGRIEIPSFNARELLKRLGVDYEPASKDALRKFSLKSEFTADLGNQGLKVSTLALAVDDIAINAVLQGSRVLDAPQWSGRVEIPSFRPDALLALLTIEARPPWKDAFAQGALQAEFNADLGRETVQLASLSLAADQLRVTGNLEAARIKNDPVVHGHVSVPPFDPRGLMKTLGLPYQPASPDVLRQVSLTSDFSADVAARALTMSQLALAVDDMAVTGDLRGTQIVDAPKWSGNFEIPRFRPDMLLALLMIEAPPPWRSAFAQGTLKASFDADVARQTVDVTALSLSADEVTLTGTLQARDWQTAPRVNGQIAIPPLNLQALLAKLGVAANIADRKALRRVAVKSKVNASRQNLVLNNLEARLDDTRLTGKLAINNLARPAYSFDLKLDEIDLDRYLPAPAAPAPGGRASSAAATATGAPAAVLPIETLRQLKLDGHAAIGKLKAFGLHSSQVDVKLKAQGGVLTIGPNQAKLYGGRYEGQTTLNAREKVPQYLMKEKLSGIDLRPFLKDAEIHDKLSGKGNLVLDLKARGFAGPGITRTLSGTMAVDVRNGEIEGINLQKSINQARAQYAQLRGKAVPVLPDARDATVFTRLSGNVVLNNGIATNNDLKMEGANLRATGKGTINLPAQTIRYRLHVTVAEGASRQGTTVPVDVTGSLAEPTYSVAWNEVLKEQVDKKIEQKKQEKKQELEDKLKEKLRKKFKLF
jgi:AsmA protein